MCGTLEDMHVSDAPSSKFSMIAIMWVYRRATAGGCVRDPCERGRLAGVSCGGGGLRSSSSRKKGVRSNSNRAVVPVLDSRQG